MSTPKILIAILLLLTFLCGATACATKEPFDAGTPLTPDEVKNLREELLQSGGKPDQSDHEPEKDAGDSEPETDRGDSGAPEAATVYWLLSGSAYHISNSCYHIKEKPNVQSGTVEAAGEAGKARACAACSTD